MLKVVFSLPGVAANLVEFADHPPVSRTTLTFEPSTLFQRTGISFSLNL
jgi:hypothetical protein